MSSFTTKTRHSLATTAKELGLEKTASRAYRTISPLARRNHRDDVNLSLLLAFTLNANSNCVDVGAHAGDILRQITRVAPEGKHLAIEPLPEQAAELVSRFPDVDVRQCALAAESGTAEFTHVETNPQLSGLRDRGFAGETTGTFEVKLERLDDLLDPELPISLIKVDVEGAELGVFEGALRTLENWHPTVVFEHGFGGSNFFGTTSDQVYDLLVDQVGLRIFDIDGGGPYSRAEFEALYNEPIWFFVAHR